MPHSSASANLVFLVSALLFVATTASAQQGGVDQERGPAAAPVAAAESRITSDSSSTTAPATQAQGDAQIEELRRRIDVLAAEVEQLRSGETPEVPLSDERRRALGLAPSAAATYRRATQGISFAGYGEMLVENFAAENQSDANGAPTTRLDFLRAVLYTGYRFNDRFLFNSEIEVEHGDEIGLEFAYVDYLANEHLTFRGGMVLIPLGLINEFHEPTVFIGARRPETEQRVIPTTWHENGGGVLGSLGIVNVRAYVTNGLRGAAFTAAGFRGGRQGGGQALGADLALSGRVDVTPIPGVFGGVGVYHGGSGQEEVIVRDETLDVGTTIIEGHVQAQIRGLDFRALFAQTSVDDAGALSRALRLPFNAPVAERMRGGYGQLAYNVLSQVNTTLAVMPYVRYEQVNTQDRIPAGFTADPLRDGTFKTLGVEVKPIASVVIKTDYQWITNDARTGRNQFNLNLGYAF